MPSTGLALNITSTSVLAPSTEPLLQKFLKGENFASNFSISATDESLLYLSLPCLSFDVKDMPSCKDSSIRHPNFPLCTISHHTSASTISNIKCVLAFPSIIQSDDTLCLTYIDGLSGLPPIHSISENYATVRVNFDKGPDTPRPIAPAEPEDDSTALQSALWMYR